MSLMESGKPGVVLRGFRLADLGFADQLRRLAGWNQTERDWRGYLEFEPDGCFIAEVGGEPVGTATTIRYGKRFGWIGMVLVHPERRRLGAGSQLLRGAIAYLQSTGVSAIKLDATPMGRNVYVPMGFADEYEICRYECVAPRATQPPEPDTTVQPFTPGDLEAVTRFDLRVFGADRARVLTALRGRNPEWCFIARHKEAIIGCLIAREGSGAIQVGPWMAEDSVTADCLLRVLIGRVAGRRIFVDVPGPNQAGQELMKRNGFTVQRTLTRMYLGRNAHPGEPHLVYSTGGPEKG